MTRCLATWPLTANGQTIQSPDIAFESTAPQVLSVDADGVMTAHEPGVATIRATFEQLTAELRVEVSAATPSTIQIEPDTYTGTMQTPTTFAVTVRNAEGIAFQPPGLECTTEAPDVAEVLSTTTSACVVLGVAAGETRLMARVGGLEATATLMITDPPATSIHAFEGFPDVRIAESRYLGPSFSAGNDRIVSGTARYTTESRQFVDVQDGVVTGRQVGYAKMTVEALGESYEQAIYVVPAYMANERRFPGPCTVTSSTEVRHMTYEDDLLVEEVEERDDFGQRERHVYQHEDGLLVRKESWRIDQPDLEQPMEVEHYIYEDRLLVRTEYERIRPVESVTTYHDRDEDGRLIRERRCPGEDECEVTGYWTYDELGRIATSGHEGFSPERTVYEYLDGEVRELTTQENGDMREVWRILDEAGHQRFRLLFRLRPDLGGRLTVGTYETFYDRAGNLRRTARLPRPLLGPSTVDTIYDYQCWEME